MFTNLAAALLILASAISAQSDLQCYRRTNNQVQLQSAGWFACNNTQTHPGGAQVCCIQGDECGDDSICKRTGTGDGSRWIVGGCTDPDYKDSACRTDCTGDKQTHITYNKDKKLWQCCGKNGCEEGTPTDETFKAVSPSDWTPVNGGSRHTPSPSASPDNGNSDSGNGDSLSVGEKIGIGIAVSAVVIALVAAVLFWTRTNSKRSRQISHGIKGRYEQLGRIGRAPSPQPQPYGARDQSPQPYAARDQSPEPYGRSTSPVPPVRSMEPQRGRSRSPMVDERSPLPTGLLPGQGAGPSAPDQLSVLSRDRD